MADLYIITGFLEQMRSLGFHVGEPSEPKRGRRFFGGYDYTTWIFTINGIRACVEEKFNPHRIEYKGPVPLDDDGRKLTFFNHNLRAYETDEGEWTRTDKLRHVTFP